MKSLKSIVYELKSYSNIVCRVSRLESKQMSRVFIIYLSMGFNSYTRIEKYLNAYNSKTIDFRDFIHIRFFVENLMNNSLINDIINYNNLLFILLNQLYLWNDLTD